MRRLLAVAVTAALAAAPAHAKEGVVASLDLPLPTTVPGEEITLAWSLASVDENGQPVPFGAQGIFVRLEAGDEVSTGFAGPGVDGAYVAKVVVPAGGIEALGIGLAGTASTPTGSVASPVYFPIANSPYPAVEPPAPGTPLVPTPLAPDPPTTTSEGIWPGWIALAALALAGAVGAIAFTARRRRLSSA